MYTNDRTSISRKTLAWLTLGLLLFAFAPRASAEDCLLECSLDPVGDTVGEVVPPVIEAPDAPALPPVEAPDAEVPGTELPSVEVPGEEIPEVPTVPDSELPETDPGEVVQGPGTPSLEEPEVEIPAPVKETVAEIPSVGGDDLSTDVPNPLQPVSAADGIDKLVPAAVSEDEQADATGIPAADATERVQDSLLRVPDDPTERDPNLAFAPMVSVVKDVAEEVAGSSSESIGAQLVDLATKTVKHVAFPIGLGLAVLFFLMIERRIDRKDPKLQVAPITSEFDTFN